MADAIHREDGKALVSAGSWSSLASTSIAGDDPVHKAGFNHYSDDCLLKAGQRELGVVDFIQFHTYPWAGSWGSHNPLSGKSPADYGVDKPILVGEFPAAAYEADGLPNGDSTAQVVEYLYTRDFAGGLRSAHGLLSVSFYIDLYLQLGLHTGRIQRPWTTGAGRLGNNCRYFIATSVTSESGRDRAPQRQIRSREGQYQRQLIY